VLATTQNGDCVFFDRAGGNLCAIHRGLGHGALPLACRQFPRVCLRDERGTFVALSNYCPTVARMLFRDDVDLRIVDDPPAFPPDGEYEGLDAQQAFPPLLRPGVLMDLGTYESWERFMVETFARDDVSAEGALAILSEVAEDLRRWEARGPAMEEHLRRAVDRAAGQGQPRDSAVDFDELADCYRGVLASVPAGIAAPLLRPQDLLSLALADHRWVASSWPRFARAVRRYLASRAFATWTAYQGLGIRTIVRAIAWALGVLRVEAARQCAGSSRELNEDLLVEAVRAADLLLVHLASPQDLADRLSVCEGRG
jgi:hypothetical protein